MSWVSQAKIGDKIICIREQDEMIWPANGDRLPQKGDIYTIRGFEVGSDGDVFFYLDEIRNPPAIYLDGYGETCFHYVGFRPVQHRKTDISALTALLTTAPAKVTEAA